jgi:hypothetical protein
MPKKVRIWEPMKIDAKIRVRLLNAIILASVFRPWPDSPRVNDRKIGVFPTGLTMGNSDPTIRRRVLYKIAEQARHPRFPLIAAARYIKPGRSP